MSSLTLLIIIGLVTAILVACLVYIHRNSTPDPEEQQQPQVKNNPNIECCGAHEVCEAETLLTLSEEIIYYSDEELDAYRGRLSDNYTPDEIDEFREVLMTLQMHEVTGWLKSLQLRRIEMPDTIREEALMIVDEFRQIRKDNRENNRHNG